MIVIYGIKDRLNPIKAQLSQIVQQCMGATLGLPEDRRVHRFVPLDAGEFFFPEGRSDCYTIIEINMMQGRKVETKKRLIKALFSQIEAQLGIAACDIEITIHEQPTHCWGFRGVTGDELNDLDYEVRV
ncbi:tautomerase family protein [Salinibius halmophilus]|uniref:tautomerase family protein n=1 Tax=Salinibius halmophilus TaxID=1853216 RepID=UPI000E672B9F|nr:tautomerase family protein [Salinibius halmophilus]